VIIGGGNSDFSGFSRMIESDIDMKLAGSNIAYLPDRQRQIAECAIT